MTWPGTHLHKNAGGAGTRGAFAPRGAPTLGDAPAPELDPDLEIGDALVSEGATARQPNPDHGLGGAPAPEAEKDRRVSRRGGPVPGIANSGASHHGPTESVNVQRKR